MKKFLAINEDNLQEIEQQFSDASKVTPPQPILQPVVDPLAAIIKQMAQPTHLT